MSANDQQEAFEKLLGSNLARVFDLVRFAETKNAALLTFASAWILAMLNLLSSNPHAAAGVRDCPARGPAAVRAIRVRVRDLVPAQDRHQPVRSGGGAARYWPEPGNATSAAYLSDLAREVAVNSRIVARKFRLFNLGARIVCCALIILSAPAIWQVAGWIAR